MKKKKKRLVFLLDYWVVLVNISVVLSLLLNFKSCQNCQKNVERWCFGLNVRPWLFDWNYWMSGMSCCFKSDFRYLWVFFTTDGRTWRQQLGRYLICRDAREERAEAESNVLHFSDLPTFQSVPIWSWVLGNDQKNDITDARRGEAQL